MLKKAASSLRRAKAAMATVRVLALLPCSRTESTLRASKELPPCWTNFLTIPTG